MNCELKQMFLFIFVYLSICFFAVLKCDCTQMSLCCAGFDLLYGFILHGEYNTGAFQFSAFQNIEVLLYEVITQFVALVTWDLQRTLLNYCNFTFYK